MARTLTRRALLRRGAVAAVALAAAGSGLELLSGTARPALRGARRRTYVALVDAVGRASRSQVDPSQAQAAARRFAADYADALEPTRAAIDATLDGIERAGGERPFSELDSTARIRVLRALAADPARADLAGRAVALAAAPFGPPAEDYHPVPVTL